MSFYVSTATFFLLHCDEWDRVVALPRHKFVTGATLLQLCMILYWFYCSAMGTMIGLIKYSYSYSQFSIQAALDSLVHCNTKIRLYRFIPTSHPLFWWPCSLLRVENGSILFSRALMLGGVIFVFGKCLYA